MGAGLVLEGGRWMSQEEMIEAMRDGDMEAFHLFYQDTARPVYSFILSLTRNPGGGRGCDAGYLPDRMDQGRFLCPPGQSLWPGVFTDSQESLLVCVSGSRK